MNTLTEYINIYKQTDIYVKKLIYETEMLLDNIYTIQSIDSISELEGFFSDEFLKSEKSIGDNTKKIVDHLSDLEEFCKEDIKEIIRTLESTKFLEMETALKLAEDLNWLTDKFLSETLELDLKNKIENIISFNKKVKSLIENIKMQINELNISEIKAMIEKNLEINQFNYTIEKIVAALSFNYRSLYKLKQVLSEYYVSGDKNKISENLERFIHQDIIEYLNRYTFRLSNYIYLNNRYPINFNLENHSEQGLEYNLPIYDIYEMLDNLLYLAASKCAESKQDSLYCRVNADKEKCHLTINFKANAFEKNSREIKNLVKIIKRVNGELNINQDKNFISLTFSFPVIINVKKIRKNIILVMGLENDNLENIKMDYKGNNLIHVKNFDEVSHFKKNNVFLAADLVLLGKNYVQLGEWLESNQFKGEIAYV